MYSYLIVRHRKIKKQEARQVSHTRPVTVKVFVCRKFLHDATIAILVYTKQ